jgi:Mitochondrial carrier protein
VYKYGGQLWVRDFLTKHFGNNFDSFFGKKTGKAMLHATAGRCFLLYNCSDGSLIGIGEIFLLPLDVLKIKRQTNPEAFRGRGLIKIVRDEGFALYRGWEWTAARNAPGSFAVKSIEFFVTDKKLFGGSAFTKEYVFGLKDYNSATWTQNTIASMAGAIASLTVSAPMDVIKTRIQNKNFENPETGFQILKNTIRNEGLTAFFKGLTPKLLTVGPKLVFSYDPLVLWLGL